MSPKFVITEPLPLVKEEISMLEKHGSVVVCSSPDADVLRREVSDAEVLLVVYAKITRDIIEGAPKLRGIVRYGIGVDNVDVEAATERGVIVANVPDYAIETVADHTMALILALARRIVLADRLMRDRRWGIWTVPSPEIRGVELRGKALGLIGLGRIGRAVAERAKPFGMRVMATDPYVTRDVASQLGVELVDLESLLKSSDFISIHAPLTPETRELLNAEAFAKMKDGVFIINTARGPLIDQKALVEAIRVGKVRGAALDVFYKEPPDTDDPLLDLDNVVLTPHIAWYTEEALRRLELTAVQHAIDILHGKVPASVVNPGAIRRGSTG